MRGTAIIVHRPTFEELSRKGQLNAQAEPLSFEAWEVLTPIMVNAFSIREVGNKITFHALPGKGEAIQAGILAAFPEARIELNGAVYSAAF